MSDTLTLEPQSTVPFGLNFEEIQLEGEQFNGSTNTKAINDDDTNHYKKTTEDYDT